MAFNNSANRVTLKGWVASELVSTTPYSVEFTIAVPRKVAQGERNYPDFLTVYANKTDVCSFCKSYLKQNTPIVVRGEIRKFYGGDIKICSDDITVSTKRK